MNEIVIVSAVRTPLGSFGGALKTVPATRLGATAIKGAIEKIALAPEHVTDVIMGNVISANTGQAPARQAAIFAGLPPDVNCTTVNKVCASGMKAISMAAQSLQLGDAKVVIAGGMESMSNVPFYADIRWGQKYGNTSLTDGLAKDGLTDVYNGKAMGIAAELCASECGISRTEQDAYAIASYERSQNAWDNNLFADEIIPVPVTERGQTVLFAKDEEPFNVKFDKIAGLKPAFDANGTVTAANASTMNDGAAALVITTAAIAGELGLKPIAKIIGYADAEQSPEWFTTTPSLALPKAIEKAGLQPADIDYWEINEAFSVVAIENMRRMKVDHSKINVLGGAVALGHPLGASGARIIVTLINVLKQNNARYGAAGICNGGGGASAMVIENLG